MPKYDVTTFPFVPTFISGMSSRLSYVLNRGVTESTFSDDNDTSTEVHGMCNATRHCSFYIYMHIIGNGRKKIAIKIIFMFILCILIN